MTRIPLLIAALAVGVAACGDEPSAPEAVPTVSTAIAQAPAAEVPRGLAALRAATARFHRFEVAYDAGYTFLFADACMEGQTGDNAGGMGYHYVDTSLLDGAVDVTTPEALLYEPGPNGQMRLVAVEYVIPESEWTGPGVPTLLGQELELNAFGLHALHAWVWKNNPDGVFASWNPNVSCAHASSAANH